MLDWYACVSICWYLPNRHKWNHEGKIFSYNISLVHIITFFGDQYIGKSETRSINAYIFFAFVNYPNYVYCTAYWDTKMWIHFILFTFSKHSLFDAEKKDTIAMVTTYNSTIIYYVHTYVYILNEIKVEQKNNDNETTRMVRFHTGFGTHIFITNI